MIDCDLYVGPLGDLRALPSTPKVALPLAVIGGTHQSLAGGFVKDVFGHRQSWTLTYDVLTVEQAQWVETLRLGMLGAPTYLIDPRKPNRLPRDVAAGGSLTGSPIAFLSSNESVLRWTPWRDLTGLDHATLPPRRLIPGAIAWEFLAGGTQTIELAARGGDGRRSLPCLPGEPLVCSGWFTGPSGSTASMAVTVHDPHGAVVDVAASPEIALSATGWAQAAVEITLPDDVGWLRVSAAATQDGTGVVHTTGWSLVRGDDPELVPWLIRHCGYDDPAEGWRVGGGSAQVVPADSSADSTYVRPGLISSSLTLTERTY